MKYSKLIIVFLLFALISCSSTKYHTIKEVLVKVDKSRFNTKYVSTNNDELKRGIWAPAKKDDGEIIEEQEDAIILQTIGKINWKWPIWWVDNREYADVNKATIRDLDIGIVYNNSNTDVPSVDQIISNASIVNSYSDFDSEINYQNGIIPVWNSTYWGIYPAKIIEHNERLFNRFEFFPERNFSGKSTDDGVTCQSKLAKNENNGCISVIAAKKYNSIEVNADVLYNFSKIIYERGYCSHVFIGYELLFDSLELKQIADLNRQKNNWHSIASFTQGDLYKHVTLKELDSLSYYYPSNETHNLFLKGYNYIINTYRGGYEKFNYDLDSILIERLKYLPNSLDSTAKLIDNNFIETENNYLILYDYLNQKDFNKINSVLINLRKNETDLRDYLKIYNRLSELTDVLKNQIKQYKDWCDKRRLTINRKTKEVIELLDRTEYTSLNNLNQTKEKQKNSIGKLKIENYIEKVNKEKLNSFIDNILALESGSLLKFTPYYIDYIDERTDETTSLTNPIVIVKKIGNVDRKSILVKVLHLPIPNGFNSRYMRVDYSLKPDAEVVLPISELEGYPGSSSINQMNNFIDSLR